MLSFRSQVLLGVGQYSGLGHAGGPRGVDVEQRVLVARLVHHVGVVGGLARHLRAQVHHARRAHAVQLQQLHVFRELLTDLRYRYRKKYINVKYLAI